MNTEGNGTDWNIPSNEERSLLRDLIRGVVRAQGNTFIKELIRGKVKIGSTKEDFERNLSAAIDEGKLRLTDVEKWLQEVEGWGNQQIFLCRIPAALILPTEEVMRERALLLGNGDLWNVPISQTFPEQPTLTSIFFDGDVLSLTWHQGEIGWARGAAEVQMDFIREEGLEVYEFRAYRKISSRGVARFELRRSAALAAVFIDLGMASTAAGRLLFEDIVATVEKLVGVSFLHDNCVPIGDVIKALDQKASRQSSDLTSVLRAHSTRLTSKSAYLEMASSTETGSYLDDPEIGAVRQAITPNTMKALAGTKADFEFFKEVEPLSLSQNVRVYLDGKKRRLSIRKQIKATEVWAILKFLNH
jgi:hypothetical protein